MSQIRPCQHKFYLALSLSEASDLHVIFVAGWYVFVAYTYPSTLAL